MKNVYLTEIKIHELIFKYLEFNFNMAKRSTRTSTEQLETMLNFLTCHKIMLTGKLHPINMKEVEELWKNLAENLNKIKGARKFADDWKRFFIEWKSKTKKKARDLKIEKQGTGGGPPQNRYLNNYEERLMDLIGWVSIDGNNELPEEIKPIENDHFLLEEKSQSSMFREKDYGIGENREKDYGIGENFVNEDCDTPMQKKQPIIKKIGYPIKLKRKLNSNKVGDIQSSLNFYSESSEKMASSISALADSLNNIAVAITKVARAKELKVQVEAAQHNISLDNN